MCKIVNVKIDHDMSLFTRLTCFAWLSPFENCLLHTHLIEDDYLAGLLFDAEE